MVKFFSFSLVTLLFVGCGYDVPTPQQREDVADKLAHKKGLEEKIFHTSKFDIFSYKTNLNGCKKADVYIEGDGLAWITSSIISDDPTPLNPIGLKLALKDKSKCVVYLARPYQYTKSKTKDSRYWTSYRFSKEVIQSYNEILDSLKSKYGISSFSLYGYSGGGAVATLVSALRDDVDLLTTYAGNLDTAYWCKLHYLSPLSSSLNPADFTDKLTTQKQLHYIGGKDKNIDKSVFFSYYKKFNDKSNIKYKILKDYTHSCCWGK